LAKWLSHSFDRMILGKMSGGGSLITHPPVFWLLKKASRQCNFLQTFLLVKDIRNLRISLLSELMYSYVFITYMKGFTPSAVPRSLQKSLSFVPIP